MHQVVTTRWFPSTPEKLWEAYTDHETWNTWAGVHRSTLEVKGTPHRNGTGAVRCLGSRGLDAFEEILDFEPPRRMTYRHLRGGLPMKNHLGEVLFHPEGEGTRITWKCRFESRIPGLGIPMKFFVGRFFRGALEGLARNRFRETPSCPTSRR